MARKSLFTHIIRIDMTPMVDLGFLLILFFMMNILLSKPNMIKLNMPANEISETRVIGCFLVYNMYLILGKDNRIFWYNRSEVELGADKLIEINYGLALRKLLLQQRKEALDTNRFIVTIYATDDANYKNVVDVLDEMAIIKQDRYVLADITPKEKLVYEAKVKP